MEKGQAGARPFPFCPRSQRPLLKGSRGPRAHAGPVALPASQIEPFLEIPRWTMFGVTHECDSSLALREN